MSRLDTFAELVISTLNSITSGGDLKVVVGAAALAENTEARRIVWTRSQNACVARYADRQTGGAQSDDGTVRENSGIDREETATAHIREADEDALEKLFDEFLTALRKLPDVVLGLGHAPTGPRGLSYHWETKESHMESRSKIVIDVSYRLPVVTESKSLVIIKAVVTGEAILTGDQ